MDDSMGTKNQIEFIHAILVNLKFKSLFVGSLEMSKFVFAQSLLDMTEDDTYFNK